MRMASIAPEVERHHEHLARECIERVRHMEVEKGRARAFQLLALRVLEERKIKLGKKNAQKLGKLVSDYAEADALHHFHMDEHPWKMPSGPLKDDLTQDAAEIARRLKHSIKYENSQPTMFRLEMARNELDTFIKKKAGRSQLWLHLNYALSTIKSKYEGIKRTKKWQKKRRGLNP